MAESGGGAPAPPKRPTIIRPSRGDTNDDIADSPPDSEPSLSPEPDKNDLKPVRPLPVPSRPAPPRPGAAPTRAATTGPSRPGPPRPASREISSQESTINGSRPSPSLPRSRPTNTPSPAEKSTAAQGSVKRRLEITVVGARPMSQVGFRDERPEASAPRPLSSPASPAEVSNGVDTEEPSHPMPSLPPPPLPNIRPGLVKDPPPVASRNNPSGPASSSDGSGPPAPVTVSRGPPPPVPSQPVYGAPIKPPSSRPPPPVPGRTGISPTSSNSNTDIPPPIPDRQYSPEEVESTSPSPSPEHKAPPEKPRRPTIIRPGRPSTQAPVDTTQSETVLDPTPAPVPRASPRPTKRNIPTPDDSKSELLQPKVSPPDSSPVNSESSSSVEFLKLKLKPTVPSSSSPDVSEGNKSSSPTEQSKSEVSKRPPSVAPKPKPSVLPKPKSANKPSNTSGEQTTDKAPSDVNRSESDTVAVEASKENVKPSMFKRPTIIRPGKPSMSSESETSTANKPEVPRGENKVSGDTDKISRSESDWLANKPMSVTKSNQNSGEDKGVRVPMSRSMDFAADDMSIDRRPKPIPRSSSGRPMSVAVPHQSPVSPRSGYSENMSSSGMPKRPSLQAQRKSSFTSSSENPPQARPAGPRIIGVPVLPLPQAKPAVETEPHNKAPPARPPAGPPPQHKSSTVREEEATTRQPVKPSRQQPVRKSSSSSSEEDFQSIPPSWEQKPPNPQSSRPLPPRPAARGSVSGDGSGYRGEDEEEKTSVRRPPPPTQLQNSTVVQYKEEIGTAKPVRPSAPPPGKSPSTPSEQKEQASKPPRPGPAPVKTEPPVRPGKTPTKPTDEPELPPRPGPGHPLYHYMVDGPHGVAHHGYTALHHDELSFNVGDVVSLVRRIDDQWLVGKVADQQGMFPSNFVDIKVPLKGEVISGAVEESDSSQSESEFFDASNDKPDTIGHGPRCRARFDFEGEGRDDLTFEDGDIIKLLERVGPEWARGVCEDRKGIFPLGYVEIIEDLPIGDIDEIENYGNYVTAMFDFDGDEDEDELSFQAGEIIEVQRMVNENWLYGEIGKRRGTFPKEFVDHVPIDLLKSSSASGGQQTSRSTEEFEPVEMRKSRTCQQRPTETGGDGTDYCVAIFDYPGASEDDLVFNTGDRIEIIEHIGSDWLRGRLHGQEGLFPVTFVKISENQSSHTTESSANVGALPVAVDTLYGIALHDFDGEADNELTFKTGDRICLLETVDHTGEWRWGRLADRKGIFPSAFVEKEM